MKKSELIELAKSLGASDEALKGKTNKELKDIIAELELQAKQEQGTKVPEEKGNPKKENLEEEDPKEEDPKEEDPEGEDPEGEDPEGEDPEGEDPEGEETTIVDSYTDDRGIVWEFKKSAPKTVRFDGRKMTQDEILSDVSIISELVYGNSNLLTKKN